MTMLVCWLVFPLLLGAAALGTGLAVERAGGWRMPGTLLAPVGFTGLVCLTQATTLGATTAPLTPVVIVAVAGAGLFLGRARLRAAGLDRWAVALAVGVFLLFGAPALLTGEPTLLGYGSLGDAANHFVLIDRLMSHGYSLADVLPSSFRGTVDSYFSTAYPTGAHTVLGGLRALTGTDVAWLLQPYLAGLAALAALGLQSLVAPYVRARGLASAVAGLSVSAGLVYGYAINQQALKELAALVCILAAVGVVRPLLEAAPGWRAALPAAVVVGGGLGVLSLAVAPWIAPLAVLVLVVLIARHARRRPAPLVLEIAAFAAVAALFALPAFSRLGDFVATTDVSLPGAADSGNLLRPLQLVQALGIWPAPDFRYPMPYDLQFGWVLVGIAAGAAMLGALVAIRRGAWPVLLFAAVSLIGFATVAGRASPWAYGKALMLLAPVALLLGGLAAATWWEGRRRAEALALALVLAGGVAWTDALAYHDSGSSPYTRLSELSDVGKRFAGQGPIFYVDYEELSKHFLRDVRPVAAAEPYGPAWAALRPGRRLSFGYPVDLDSYVSDTVARYFPLLLVRPGPGASRPSADYELAWQGRYYDVWRRIGSGSSRVLEHLPVGDALDAAATPDCAAVRRLAGRARVAGARLAYAPRPATATAPVVSGPVPAGWAKLPGDDDVWRLVGQGRVQGGFDVTARGRYEVWLEGSIGRRATVSVDGRPVGSLTDQVNLRPQDMRVGAVALAPGPHTASVDVAGGTLAPGNGSRDRLVGPVSLTASADPTAAPVRTVAPRAYRAVCLADTDWVEVVR